MYGARQMPRDLYSVVDTQSDLRITSVQSVSRFDSASGFGAGPAYREAIVFGHLMRDPVRDQVPILSALRDIVSSQWRGINRGELKKALD